MRKTLPFNLFPHLVNKLSRYFRISLPVISIALLIILSIPVKSFSQGVIPSKGKDFWLGFPYNPRVSFSTNPKRCDIFITSNKSTSGTVYIPGQGWSQAFTVTAYTTTTIHMPEAQVEDTLTEIATLQSVHIVTSDTVSVFAIPWQDYSTDASVIYPRPSTGIHYRISSYTGLQTSSPPNLSSDFLIVATEDSTSLQITPSAPTLGGRPALHLLCI